MILNRSGESVRFLFGHKIDHTALESSFLSNYLINWLGGHAVSPEASV